MYLDRFECKEDVEREFCVQLNDGENILFAEYTYEDYSGSSWVIFEKDGKLFEVHGSHCSCYGLEGQWEPEETSLDAIKERISRGGHTNFAVETILEELKKLEENKMELDDLPNAKDFIKEIKNSVKNLATNKEILDNQESQIKNIQQKIVETIKTNLLEDKLEFSLSTPLVLSVKAKELPLKRREELLNAVNELFTSTKEKLQNKGYASNISILSTKGKDLSFKVDIKIEEPILEVKTKTTTRKSKKLS